jgi:hypothetical protein
MEDFPFPSFFFSNFSALLSFGGRSFLPAFLFTVPSALSSALSVGWEMPSAFLLDAFELSAVVEEEVEA